MRVIIYVEGISDKLSMEALLSNLVEVKRQEGHLIEFFETMDGDRKASVLTKVPVKAVNILRNSNDTIVIAMPDLYPKNKAFSHQTFEELRSGILQNYLAALNSKGLANDARLVDSFKVFCFKYDLEALILAAEESLKIHLGIDKFPVSWVKPVENQNHDKPPKHIVAKLFSSCKKNYVEQVDAPAILRRADCQVIAQRCSQCFQPFLEFLEAL